MSIWYWIPVPNRTRYIWYRYPLFLFFGTGSEWVPCSSLVKLPGICLCTFC
ncbi:hypothetical protein Hanom_Chr08g00734841 [Helianthus anomalus]